MRHKIGSIYIATIRKVTKFTYLNRFKRVTHSNTLPGKFILIKIKDEYFETPYGVKIFNKSSDTDKIGDLFTQDLIPITFIGTLATKLPIKLSKIQLKALQEHINKNNN